MKDTKNKLFANMNVNVNTNTKSSSSSSSSSNGFTIIEVALVLAIAGLIFLVVFLALPALQNSQKDTARKQDVGRVVSALQSYESDNNGDLSSIWGAWYTFSNSSWYPGMNTPHSSTVATVSGYIGKLGSSDVKNLGIYTPSNSGYYIPSDSTQIVVFPGHDCNGNIISDTSDAAVVIRLSSGNGYCASL